MNRPGPCFWCGRIDPPFNNDHVLPQFAGGTWDADNIVDSCPPCNYERGQITDYRAKIQTAHRWIRRNYSDDRVGPLIAYLLRTHHFVLMLQRKWAAVETERLGRSPSAKMDLSLGDAILRWGYFPRGEWVWHPAGLRGGLGV